MSNPSRRRRSFRLNKGNRYWEYLRNQNQRKRRLAEPIEDLEPPTECRPPTKLEFMAYLGLMPTRTAEQPAEDKEFVTAEKEPVSPGNEAIIPEAKKTPDRMEEEGETAMPSVVVERNIAKVNPPKTKRKGAARKMSPYTVWEEHNYVKRSKTAT